MYNDHAECRLLLPKMTCDSRSRSGFSQTFDSESASEKNAESARVDSSTPNPWPTLVRGPLYKNAEINAFRYVQVISFGGLYLMMW